MLFFALIFILKSSHCFELIHKACDEYAAFTQQPYFVDKTRFLSCLFREDVEAIKTNNSKMATMYHQNIITTPHGFGKSTNLMMIKAFAQVELDTNFKPKPETETKAYRIFKPLKVSVTPRVMNISINKFYVLSIDLHFEPDQLVNETMALDVLRDQLRKLYQEYEFVRPLLKDDADHELLNKTLSCDLDRTDIKNGLINMVYLLKRMLGQREIVLLVDNYDSLIWYLIKDPKYYLRSVDELIKEMLLELTYRRLRVKYSVFFGVTNFNFHDPANPKTRHFKFYSFLNNGIFQNYFGFTPSDIDDLMLQYNCSKAEKAKIFNYYKPYDALEMKNVIWNPTSITNYLMSRNGEMGKLEPYWGRNQSIDFLLDFAKAPVFGEKFRQYIASGKMKYSSYVRFHYPGIFFRFLEAPERDYQNLDPDDVADLFIFLHEVGFASTGERSRDGKIYRIPNTEVAETLKEKILKKLN